METLILIILSWIAYIILSASKGILDAYIWHYWLESWFKKILKENKALELMQKDGKYIHMVGAITIASPFILIVIAALFGINPIATLFLGISLSTINPLFHLGYMFKTRNKLNPKTYTEGFKSTDIISDGNTDKNKKLTNKLFSTYKKRINFAIISVIFLILALIFK
jgi:hypothetical protein